MGSDSQTGQRTENQDRVAHFTSRFGHVFVVADGMGGYHDGALAATLVTESLPGVLDAMPDSLSAEHALTETIQQLNDIVLGHEPDTETPSNGMGSTLAVLLVTQTADGFLAIGAHVGDSRIYFLRAGRLFQLTRDHTVVQNLLDTGQLTAEEAVHHPKAGALTAALGRPGPVEVSLTPWMLLQPGDLLLLCSDGISGHVNDITLRELLAEGGSPVSIARKLVRQAIEEHSTDNMSALIVRVAVEHADAAREA